MTNMCFFGRTLLLFSLLSLFCGCTSLKQPKEVFDFPDYTESDVLLAELRRIETLSKESPVMALWRAVLSGSEDAISQNTQNVRSKLEEALSENNFSSALRLYDSLLACGVQKSDLPSVNRASLELSAKNNVPGLVADKKMLVRSIQDCVNATVTIWVDRGITIHNGVGYADRVLGSGFYIDSRGYLITNHHVISDIVDPKYEGYSRLYIKPADDQDTRIPAKVVGYDKLLDLALLKVEITPPFIFELGSSSDLQIGDKVSAIGTPLGLHGTLTSGIVSSVDRKLFTTGSVFQIDTAVNSGNSGGPLIDEQRRVQAIVFAGIQQYQGLNFAIPVEYLRQDLPYLFAGGKRQHVWVGAFGHTAKESGRNNGVEVQYVMPGGVAFRSGLKKGDVITFVAGKRIYTIEDMQDLFRNYSSETIVSCSFVRDSEKKDCLLYLDERPEQPGYEIYNSDLLATSLVPLFGMELTPSSTVSARRYVISDIIKGSIADESGFSITDPVYITDVAFNDDKTAIALQMNTRKRKKGYLDISIRIASQLDSPYYF